MNHINPSLYEMDEAARRIRAFEDTRRYIDPRLFDPSFIEDTRRKVADEEKQFAPLTAQGYIGRRTSSSAREYRTPTYTPQRKKAGRPHATYFLSVDAIISALHSFVEKHKRIPTYKDIATLTGVSKDTIKRSVNERCGEYFKGYAGFLVYCRDLLKRE